MTTKQKERAEWLREERERWVMNDSDLYFAFKRSGLSIGRFIARNRCTIDTTRRVVGGDCR